MSLAFLVGTFVKVLFIFVVLAVTCDWELVDLKGIVLLQEVE
jgi:hypothetical protein